jgi:hypothetical protein
VKVKCGGILHGWADVFTGAEKSENATYKWKISLSQVQLTFWGCSMKS